MSHTVLLELNCKEGTGTNVLKGLLVALGDTRAYDGAVAIEAYVDAGNPDCIMVWEKWETPAHQEAYMKWRMESGTMDGLADALEGPPRFVHLSPVD
jgi:quinol monooxygenase YgiN